MNEPAIKGICNRCGCAPCVMWCPKAPVTPFPTARQQALLDEAKHREIVLSSARKGNGVD